MRRLALALFTLALAASPALAEVELMPDPVSHGRKIVLGDLFSGVPAKLADVVVAQGAPEGQNAVLDAGQVQMAAARSGVQWKNETGLRRIIVAGGAAADPAPRRASAAGATRQRQVLLYARNIPAGDMVAPEDLVFGEAPPEAFLTQPITDPEFAAGRTARHALRAGSPVIARDLQAAKVIRRDDLVTVAFEDEGMVLTLQGKALNDAAVGDAVQVVNPNSKKVVEAVASAPGRALVGPAAEQMRSAAQPGFNRYASAR